MGDRSTTPAATLKAVLDRNVDSFKGLLIILVTFDHNDFFRELYPDLFGPLTFHVLGFLFLPFLLGQTKLSTQFVLDRIARYWVPFLFVLTLAACAHWWLYQPSFELGSAGVNYLLAGTIGSAPLVKRSAGLLALWFLPALLGTVIVLAIYRSASKSAQFMMIATLSTAHLFVTSKTVPWYGWLPLGLAVVANIFLLGLLVKRLFESASCYKFRLAFAAIWLVSYGLLVHGHFRLEIATLDLASVVEFRTFLLQDSAGIAGMITALLIADLMPRTRILDILGKHSLWIYLLHPFCYVALGQVAHYERLHSWSTFALLGAGMAANALALGSALLGSVIIHRSPSIALWISPRHWLEWRPVEILGRMAR